MERSFASESSATILQPEGFGVECYPNGEKYSGQFANDFRHGLGRYFFENSVVSCYWKGGFPDGNGVEEKSGEAVSYVEYERFVICYWPTSRFIIAF